MSAASLYQETEIKDISPYFDRRSGLSRDDYNQRIKVSTTLYIGNLSTFTTETQLLELFSMCGQIKNFHMGLDKNTYKPCGFCFVEYHTRDEA